MVTPKFPYWRLDKSEVNDPKTHKRVQEVYEEAKAYRSEIIDASSLIEIQLDKVLCDAFIGNSPGLHPQFKAFILSAEFCTFFQKWKLLRALINSNPVWWQICKPANHDHQVKNLNNVISYRNAFAHGEIVVDSSEFRATLHYFEGEKKFAELTDEFVQEILSEAEGVLLWLAEIETKYAPYRNAL